MSAAAPYWPRHGDERRAEWRVRPARRRTGSAPALSITPEGSSTSRSSTTSLFCFGTSIPAASTCTHGTPPKTPKMPDSSSSTGARGRFRPSAQTGSQATLAHHHRIPCCEPPASRVFGDIKQNAWGRTLAPVYPARHRLKVPVSVPVIWDEAGKATYGEFPVRQQPRTDRRVPRSAIAQPRSWKAGAFEITPPGPGAPAVPGCRTAGIPFPACRSRKRLSGSDHRP